MYTESAHSQSFTPGFDKEVIRTVLQEVRDGISAASFTQVHSPLSVERHRLY